VTESAAVEKRRLKAHMIPSKLAPYAPATGISDTPVKKPHRREQKSDPIVNAVVVRSTAASKFFLSSSLRRIRSNCERKARIMAKAPGIPSAAPTKRSGVAARPNTSAASAIIVTLSSPKNTVRVRDDERMASLFRTNFWAIEGMTDG
jgi:hypothetical protein